MPGNDGKGVTMTLLWTCVLLLGLPERAPLRVEKFTMVRAHQILPLSLRRLVALHPEAFLKGLETGLAQGETHQVKEADLIAIRQKIRTLVQQQAPFRQVVFLMGYGGGLISVLLDPSGQGALSLTQRQHFWWFLDRRLHKMHFVFEGYETYQQRGGAMALLARFQQQAHKDRRLLQVKYQECSPNQLPLFSDQHAVFAIAGVFFSNWATAAAVYWQETWALSGGDVTRLPLASCQNALKGKKQ
jgi:hypothetical protein